MELTGVIVWLAAGLVLVQWVASLWLSQLNRGHVLAHATEIPSALAGVVDEQTYAQSVRYTLAKSRFSQFAEAYTSLVLVAVLFSGVLPWAYELTLRRVGSTSWALA